MTDAERAAIQTVLRIFDYDRLGHGTSIRNQATALGSNSTRGHDARSDLLEALRVLHASVQSED